MRTQDGPASSVLGGPFSHNVFLLVVMDRRNETWLRLLRWSIECPKTEAVRLGTAGKHDALKRHLARGESIERIFQHRQRRPDRSPYEETKRLSSCPRGP